MNKLDQKDLEETQRSINNLENQTSIEDAEVKWLRKASEKTAVIEDILHKDLLKIAYETLSSKVDAVNQSLKTAERGDLDDTENKDLRKAIKQACKDTVQKYVTAKNQVPDTEDLNVHAMDVKADQFKKLLEGNIDRIVENHLAGSQLNK